MLWVQCSGFNPMRVQCFVSSMIYGFKATGFSPLGSMLLGSMLMQPDVSTYRHNRIRYFLSSMVNACKILAALKTNRF